MVCYPTKPYEKAISSAVSSGKAYFGKDDFMKFWLPEKKAQGSLVKSQGNHNHLIDFVSDRSNKVGHKNLYPGMESKNKRIYGFYRIL